MSPGGGTGGARELARRELESPGRLGDLAPLAAALASDPERLAELLRAKEEQARAAWYVEAEGLWMQKLTWRLTRPLLLVGVLAAVVFVLQRAIDPTLGIFLFLLGAASLYVTIQLFAHLWARTDEKKLAQVNDRYRERLRALLDEPGQARPGPP